MAKVGHPPSTAVWRLCRRQRIPSSVTVPIATSQDVRSTPWAVFLSHDDVPGARRAARVLLRQKDTGEPVLLLSRVDPAIRDRFGAGAQFSMSFTPPDRARYRLAALKSAYLAHAWCCARSRRPPRRWRSATSCGLPETRPASSRSSCSLCEGLQIWKSHGPATSGEIALVSVQPADGSAPIIALSLARPAGVLARRRVPRCRRSERESDRHVSAMTTTAGIGAAARNAMIANAGQVTTAASRAPFHSVTNPRTGRVLYPSFCV